MYSNSQALQPAGALSELKFSVLLTGREEVPPVITPTVGKIGFIINEALTEIKYDLRIFEANRALEAHLHCAPSGKNGPIIIFLASFLRDGLNGDIKIKGTLTDKDITNIECGLNINQIIGLMVLGGVYVNVNSFKHPGGVIRGQIVLD